MISILFVFVAVFGMIGFEPFVAASTPQALNVPFTVTTSHFQDRRGSLLVVFDSIELTTFLPQAYSFNVVAETGPGQWITRLVWHFGDGAVLNVPYCCHNMVSEVRYHIYAQEGCYTVKVVAFDNFGNSGIARATVNWNN
jgi:PKD repeat protein